MFRFLNNFGRSGKWSKVRKQHLKIQPECQACGNTKSVEVHHIEPFHVNPSKELDPNNLITLCSKSCHLIFGHLMDYKSWNKDVIKDCYNYKNKLHKRPYHEKLTTHSGNITIFQRIINFIGWNN